MRIDEKLVQYEAALILRNTLGIGAKKIAKILNTLGFYVSENIVHGWIYSQKIPTRKVSPLLKSLFYRDAYKLALKIKKENPNWGPTRIKTRLKRLIGIWIPEMTIYYWVRKKAKPNIMFIRFSPELGYIIGTCLSDAKRTTEVSLKVRDKDYVTEYALSLTKLTGKKYEVKENNGWYEVRVNGSALRYMVKTGLWKVVAYVYTREFLQGLFDGDGYINVSAKNSFKVVVGYTSSNIELLNFCSQLLKQKYGIKVLKRTQFEENDLVKIKGRKYRVKRTELIIIYRLNDLKTFSDQIGFKIKRKKEKLADALNILSNYRGKERIRKWKEMYEKINGKWIKRASPTSASIQYSYK